MHLLKIVFFVFVIFIELTSISYAGGFRIVHRDYITPITENIKLIKYIENQNDIELSIQKTSFSNMCLYIKKNHQLVFSKDLELRKYGFVRQIYNRSFDLYFYIIDVANYMEATPGDINYIIGENPLTHKWEVYIYANDYYNAVGDSSYPWIDVNKNGDLILSYSNLGRNLPRQEYTYSWNDGKVQFDYKDSGVFIY